MRRNFVTAQSKYTVTAPYEPILQKISNILGQLSFLIVEFKKDE